MYAIKIFIQIAKSFINSGYLGRRENELIMETMCTLYMFYGNYIPYNYMDLAKYCVPVRRVQFSLLLFKDILFIIG